MRKVLIVGRMPPPVGGVTVHTSRLIEHLRAGNFPHFEFVDCRRSRFPVLLWRLAKRRTIHLQVSNPYVQLAIAIFCRLTWKKLIITYHGSWGRYNGPGNLAVALSARLATVPIVQNQVSFRCALRWNRNARLISTYLPSCRMRPLGEVVAEQLATFRSRFKTVICTNAWHIAFDKDKRETYGISDLVNWVAGLPDVGLVISDPSGSYAAYLRHIPKNVRLISVPHDFRNILASSDVFIRNTTTDGVSLSIYEALEANIPVLASDSVERAPHCQLFNDLWQLDLHAAIDQARTKLDLVKEKDPGRAALRELIAVYEEVLGLC